MNIYAKDFYIKPQQKQLDILCSSIFIIKAKNKIMTIVRKKSLWADKL